MELENDYWKGRDNHPDTTTSTYNLLNNYNSFKSTLFSHQGELVGYNQKTGKTGYYIKDVVCRKFKKKGHCANKFPSLHDDDSKSIEAIVVHVQNSGNDESDSEYSDFSFMTIVID